MPILAKFKPDSVWQPTTSMTRHKRIPQSMGLKHTIWLPLLVGTTLFANISAAAINLMYCSPENTGLDYAVFTSIYQSDGKCHDRCVENYAFAIVLYQSCWCSNYPPIQQKDLGDCSDPCPGYPSDKCGNLKQRYYNYIELGQHLPSSRTDQPASSTSVRSSRLGSVTVSVSFPVTVTFTPPGSSTQTTNKPPTTNAPGTTNEPPAPIISVTTIQGSQKTITIMPDATGPSTSSFAVNGGEGRSFFSDAGRVAGVFVGLAAAVLLIVGLIFFFRKRRSDRRQSISSSNNPEMGMSGAGSPNLGTGSSSPNGRPRSTSTLGLVGGYHSDKAPVITTTGFTETDRITDQRLDPNQIWMRFDNENGSRVSLRSLQDNQDYSRRVLKLTNPDG